MTGPLPDVDALVRGALAAALPAVAVFTLWPEDWYERLPLVVARAVGGAMPHPRFVGASVIDVQTCSRDRGEASTLVRQAVLALFDACRTQYADSAAGGYLSYFDPGGSSAPTELRAGSAAVAHTDTYRFQATCLLHARPSRAA